VRMAIGFKKIFHAGIADDRTGLFRHYNKCDDLISLKPIIIVAAMSHSAIREAQLKAIVSVTQPSPGHPSQITPIVPICPQTGYPATYCRHCVLSAAPALQQSADTQPITVHLYK